MSNNQKMRILVFVIVVFAITFSFISLRSQGQDDPNRTNQNKRDISEGKKQWLEYESQFPISDYDAPEPENLEEREKRKKKNNRYDSSPLVVSKNPHPNTSETSMIDGIDLPPAMPTLESRIIVVGEILTAQAHLSNNKRGIYSEFTIRVEEVLKNNDSDKLIQGSSITADRPGGSVRYSNGQKVVYSVHEIGLPRIGRRYVLFLTKPDQSSNYYILTGYEQKEGKVVQIDNGLRFMKFKGMNETDFIKTIREALAQPRQKTDNRRQEDYEKQN